MGYDALRAAGVYSVIKMNVTGPACARGFGRPLPAGHDFCEEEFAVNCFDYPLDPAYLLQKKRSLKRQLLEKQGRGLNLTWEVVDGIRNHKSSGTPHTLEGQIVRLSDKIAYINHDIDDAIRGGLLTEQDLPAEYTDVLGHSTRMRLNTMIHDVVTHSMDRPEIIMSERIRTATMGLRRFLFENVYQNPVAKGEETKAIGMIQNLYGWYLDHMELIPQQYLDMVDRGIAAKERVVCDYIAGMTDSYAVKKFQEYFIPESWKN